MVEESDVGWGEKGAKRIRIRSSAFFDVVHSRTFPQPSSGAITTDACRYSSDFPLHRRTRQNKGPAKRVGGEAVFLAKECEFLDEPPGEGRSSPVQEAHGKSSIKVRFTEKRFCLEVRGVKNFGNYCPRVLWLKYIQNL